MSSLRRVPQYISNTVSTALLHRIHFPNIIVPLIGLAAACTVGSAVAQVSSTPYEEQSRLIRAPRAYASIGTDLFGDAVNLFNGTVRFHQQDVSIPGNNGLAVAIGRTFTAGVEGQNDGAFGSWHIDIPRIHGIFSNQFGWKSRGTAGARCSMFSAPEDLPGVLGRSGWEAKEYWQGTFLYTPETGDQEMLRRSSEFTLSPSNPATYPVVTSNFWTFSCLPALANPSAQNYGEGFIAVSPSGVSYRFDWMTGFQGKTLSKAEGNFVAKEFWILPTLVTDRFGNWVRYSYDPAIPGNLTRIEASDGRYLDIHYYPSDLPAYPFYSRIHTISDGERTWTYNYNDKDLASVILPDNSAWAFGSSVDFNKKVRLGNTGCDSMANLIADGYEWTMQHPSGASGRFRVESRAHGRSDVIRTCDENGSQVPDIQKYYYTMALVNKTISGPGIGNLTWTYDYGAPVASWAPCDASCVFSKTVKVTDPAQQETRYTFGTRFMVSEGRVESVDQAGLRTTTTEYRPFGAGPYADRVGYSDSAMVRGDSDMAARLAPVQRKTITQQGVNFTWQADASINGFDEFARPKLVTRFSSLGSRVEATSYSDNLGKWVLGQVGTVTSGGKTMVANQYNQSFAMLESVSKFGLLQQSMTYNTDGTLATRSDNLGHTTTFADYKRGIPRIVRYADNTTERADVNNDGTIAWIADQMEIPTHFDYQNGRLSRITYGGADGDPAWNATTLTLTQVNTDEFDLGAGHWRQDVVTGNAWTRTYLDALWRPAYTWTYENNVSTSQTLSKTTFDHAGRATYTSYPQAGYVAALGQNGVRTFYDGIGRAIEVRADSELGPLSTYSNFNGGFSKTVQDPRGNVSTTTYQAFDSPSEEAITGISAPEGLQVAIDRDIFGKPRSITRSGNGVAATRSYVYDGYERLCKTIEPETGATLQQLDGANNVSWRAPGSTLTSPGACDLTSVPASGKIVFGYDTMNRLLSTTYGDGSAAIGRDYYNDGQPRTVSSSGAVWTMEYNSRRLPTRQSLAFEGQTYVLQTAYNANGHPVQLSYPSATNAIANQSISYEPDALGRPSRVGAYATGILYHPSGAIANFTYGNGKVRTMAQNVRGLPETALDTGVLNDAFAYDANGNVKSITDNLNISGIPNTTRTMEYDGLDRLKSVFASGLWGTARYDYDALDNLTHSTIGGRDTSHNYSYGGRNLLENLQSTTVGVSALFSYDNRGNVTRRGGQDFTFDLGNRLTSATSRDTYVYDGFGRRIKTSAVDGTVTISVYSPAGQLLYTRRTGGPNPAKSTQYIYLHTHQIAEVTK